MGGRPLIGWLTNLEKKEKEVSLLTQIFSILKLKRFCKITFKTT